MKINSPAAAKRHNIALLTEERRVTGIFPVLSVYENTIIASLGRYRNRVGLLDEKKGREEAREQTQKFRTKTPSVNTLIRNLSGGNQQKGSACGLSSPDATTVPPRIALITPAGTGELAEAIRLGAEAAAKENGAELITVEAYPSDGDVHTSACA